MFVQMMALYGDLFTRKAVLYILARECNMRVAIRKAHSGCGDCVQPGALVPGH